MDFFEARIASLEEEVLKYREVLEDIRDGVYPYKDMLGCLNCKRATVKELREMARKALLNKEEPDEDIPF